MSEHELEQPDSEEDVVAAKGEIPDRVAALEQQIRAMKDILVLGEIPYTPLTPPLDRWLIHARDNTLYATDDAGIHHVIIGTNTPTASVDKTGTQAITNVAAAVGQIDMSLGDGIYILIGTLAVAITSTGVGDITFQLRVGGSAVGNAAIMGDPGAATEALTTLVAVETVTGGPKTFDVTVKKDNAGGVAAVQKVNTRLIAFIPAGGSASGLGVTDHGALDGLDDDDHGAIYYTEAEVDALLHAATHTLASHSARAHGDLSDAPASAHHTKYLDAAAIAAVEGEGSLALTGNVTIAQAKTLKVGQIDEIAAAAGVTIDGLLIKDSGIPELAVTAHVAALDHDALLNFLSAEHQTKYTNAEAVSAVEAENPLDVAGSQDFTQISAPGAPASGKTRLYTKTDGKFYRHPEGGAETELGGGGGVTDHGALTGLDDDDHTVIYYTRAAVDALLHAAGHTAASHSDQGATGAELEELTDASETTLHSHASGGGGSHTSYEDKGSGSMTLTLTDATIAGLSISLPSGNYILWAQVQFKVTTNGCGDLKARMFEGSGILGNQSWSPDVIGRNLITMVKSWTVTDGPKTITVKVSKTSGGGDASAEKAFCRIIALSY